MSSFLCGFLAALAAPLVMTIGFIIWDDQWKGSAFALNLFKCNLASIGFLIATLATSDFSPQVFTSQSVGYLFLSSFIGIIVGDLTWLQGLKMIGARRVILIDSFKPFLAAFFGWLVLDETLKAGAFAGIALTVVGVAVASLEQEAGDDEKAAPTADDKEEEKHEESTAEFTVSNLGDSTREFTPSNSKDGTTQEKASSSVEITPAGGDVETGNDGETTSNVEDDNVVAPQEESSRQQRRNKTRSRRQVLRLGYTLSFINVLLDTYGSVLTKQHGVGMTTWEINLLRFGFAGAFNLVVSMLCRVHAAAVRKQSKSEDIPWYSLPLQRMTLTSWSLVVLGVLFVTFATPALSNYALFQIALALALTLGSVGPLYSIPLSYLLQQERPTVKTILGAVLAVGGICILAFFGTS